MFLKRNVGVLKKDQVRRYIDLQHSSPPSSRHDRESVRLGLALGRLLHPNFVAPGRDLPIWKNSFFNVDFDSFNWHGFSLALSIAPLRVGLFFLIRSNERAENEVYQIGHVRRAILCVLCGLRVGQPFQPTTATAYNSVFIDIYCIHTYMRTTEHQYVYTSPLI